MLRTFQIVRLANNHSPEKEQRLLSFANSGQNPLDPERLKQIEAALRAGQDPESGNTVEGVQSGIEERLRETTPELLLQNLKGDDLIQALAATGGVDEVSDWAKGGLVMETPVTAPPKARSEFVNRLLLKADDSEILRLIQVLHSELERHERLLVSVEHNLQWIFEKTDDTAAVEKAMNQLIDYESRGDGQAVIQELEMEEITEANVAEKLGVKERPTSADERAKLLQSLKLISEAQRERRLFGQRFIPEASWPERKNIRADYIHNLQKNMEILAGYFDARINARAAIVLKKVNEVSDRYQTKQNEDARSRYKITSDGIDEACGEASTTLHEIRREFTEAGIAYAASKEGGMVKLKNRVTIDDPHYIAEAESALRKLERLQFELEVPPDETLPRLLIELREKEPQEITWARDQAKRLYNLDLVEIETKFPAALTLAHNLLELFDPFMPGNMPDEDEAQGMCLTDARARLGIARTILLLENNPQMLAEGEAYDKELDSVELPDQETDPQTKDRGRKFEVQLSDRVIASEVADQRKKLERVLPSLSSYLQHPTARLLDLTGKIKKLKEDIEADWKTGMNRCLVRANRKIKKLEECDEVLGLLFTEHPSFVRKCKRKEYEGVVGAKRSSTLGFYSYKEGRIFLNIDEIEKTEVDRESVVNHELGHAIIDTFRRKGVFPNILINVREELRGRTTTKGEVLEDLLVRRAEAWGISIKNPAKLTYEENWTLMDELINRCALWKEKGEPQAHEDEKALFELLGEYKSLGKLPQSNSLTGGAFMAADDLTGAPTDAQTPNAGDSGLVGQETFEEKKFVDSQFEKLRKFVLDIDAFIRAYPEYKVEIEETLGYEKMKEGFKKARQEFIAGKEPNHEDLEGWIKRMSVIKEAIEKIDSENLDLTYKGKTGSRGLWRIITEDVAWMSLYDIANLYKDVEEDIKRMWKRRGESARNRFGRDISTLIPDGIPYFGRLKHEFERRDKTSEEEEVGVWEKGLEKIDAHELQHTFIPRARTKDQLKAIIRILAKKGRLDLDDQHGLWAKLEYLSGYRMPRIACERDPNLRNQWLQKMMADIWGDKDQFEHWKAENDGAIESGRKHLDNTVEGMSASGTLDTNLKKLLKNYTKLINHEPLSKEEEINPHLYEGILYYAMRNGKMSMEQKFFYLIKGVETGLLSIDRLRTFSGENFGILNQFPFIDFFSTSQNCTMHEIKAISRRVTEKGRDADPFKPGPRMTKFLMEVVAFDKSVYDRVNKGLKDATKIDHEDIPMLITQIDFAGVHNIINFQSGSQAKVSAAAMMNGYVGYNSFLKYFGIKSKIGHPPITTRDLSKLAQTLGGYAAWDNKITRFSLGAAADQVPRLTWQQINGQAPVSGQNPTKEYRNAMNNLTLELCQELGINQVNDIDIDDFIGVNRHGGSAKELLKKYTDRKVVENAEGIYKKVDSGYQEFVDTLEKKMKTKEGKETVERVLQKHEESLIPETSSFTRENLQEFWIENNGNGNGNGHDYAGAIHHVAHH